MILKSQMQFFCAYTTSNSPGATIKDSYPLSNINDIHNSIGTEKYFSVFNLTTGFHHIKMDPKDYDETAFFTPHGH